MPMIQVGPAQFMDAALAKARGIPIYRAPSKAAPKTARPATQAPVETAPRAPATKQPRDLPEAMSMGRTNDQIHDLIRRGVIRRPESMEAAAREFGNSKVLHEAERRGLLWGLI